MALIVEYHVIADMYPCQSAVTAGMLVTLDSSGYAVAAPTGTTADSKSVLGIAGDTYTATAGQTTAYSDGVTIGGTYSSQRWTSNRVSDLYNEVAASGKITVYHGGGKFWISEGLFDAADSVVIGSTFKVSGITAGKWAIVASDYENLALAVGANQAYQSGVPGTDTNGSISLGKFVPVILKI